MAANREIPNEQSRWRCSHCGNLTRFDVTSSTRVREYWHLDLAGVATVEETEILAGGVEEIRCRWCGSADAIEVVPRPEFGGPTESEGPGGP